MGQNEQRSEPVGWPAPLLDVLVALVDARRVFLVCVIGGALLTAAWMITTPPFYRSIAIGVLMPREKPSLDAQVRTEFIETATDSARKSEAGALMLPPNTELYTELLRSERVLAGISRRMRERLTSVEDVTEAELTAKVRRMAEIVGSKHGLITVSVTADDAYFAAELANAIIEEGAEASQLIERRLLLEQVRHLGESVTRVRTELEVDEARLEEFCARQNLIDPNRESGEVLRQIRETTMIRDRLLRERAEREISYTEDDPGVRRLTASIATAKRRLADLRDRVAGGVSSRNYGALVLEYEGLSQRVRSRRDLLHTLRTQHNLFEARAEQPTGSLVTIKRATPPLTPAGPSRRRGLGLGLGVTLIVGVAVALLRQQWRRALSRAECANRMQHIRRGLRRRRGRVE